MVRMATDRYSGLGEQAFIDGDYDIHWLEKLVGLKK
jgi:hypothetical protein